MIETKYNIREFSSLSTEDFQEVFGRKQEILKITSRQRERDYHEYAKSEEAFFGANNVYKTGLISLIGELRSIYQDTINEKENRSKRREFSKSVKPILEKIEKHIEKTFNIKKCYFGLIDDLNAWCIPLCFDSKLATKKDGKTVINEKVKVSLEDIMETGSGYKYKDSEGKVYCVSFGIHFLDKGPKGDYFTDAECAAIMSHEFGHAMQQAVCSINENLASVYMHSLFEDIYSLLNPVVGVLTLGISYFAAILEHKSFKEMKEENPEYIGDQIIKDEIGAHKKDYDREIIGKQIDEDTERIINTLPKKKDNKILRFFGKFISFTLGGLCNFLGDIINSVLSIPSNIYASTQSGFLKHNRRFEQFADVFAASYGLGAEQASAISKIGNMSGYKQDYGILNLLNYVPLVNIITGVSHYTSLSMVQLANGYPDMTGRMAAMYKSLKNDLDNNKDLSASDKKYIQDQIDNMNDIYNNYVYDWSPKGFVYAIWHKIRFKSLKNEKSDVETNVLEALKDYDKEQRFKNKNKTKNDKEIKIEPNKLMSVMLGAIKNFKSKYGSKTKKMVEKIEPELRSI